VDVYRVEIHDWVNRRKVISYAEWTGERLQNGFPCWRRVVDKTPACLWSGKDARAIRDAARKKPWCLDARAVEDDTAAGQLGVRCPTGEKAA
jgi:hypothetical protein